MGLQTVTHLRILLVAAIAVSVAQRAAADADAEEILRQSGVRGGLVVHLGCGDGKLTAALRPGDGYLVHGLDTDANNVEKAREYLRSLGVYGPVAVDTFDGEHLPYADNLVNLVVAEDPAGVSAEEITRVLAPLGVAYTRKKGEWTKTVKPWPPEIDEWPQYLHGADNNAVAHDAVVGPPRHLQWVSDPAWSRSHMTIPTVVSMVSARGRLFTIEDRATPENPFLPGKFALVARGAFNGVVLWRHDFPDWEPVTRYVKDIAIQLQRRLAAVGDLVYCTPGLEAPLTAFDAATGRVLKTYEGTRRTQEFAYHEGVLYAVVGDRMNAAQYNIVKPEPWRGENLGGSDPEAPFGGTGFRGAYSPESPDRADPTCDIVAIEADSGRGLWRIKNVHGYVACTLAIKGSRAVFQTGGGLFCLNRATGERLWSVDKPIASKDGTEANTLVLSDDTVYAQEGGSLYAYSLEDGAEKWKAPIANNYEKSADLFLAAGAVWTGGAGKPTSRDPETGEQIAVYTQRMTGPMGHDRCYRNFITDRFYINSKTGGADFVTLDEGREFPNYWLRGTCGMGVLPCNGLLYAPPYSCQCSAGAMLQEFNAVYAEKGLQSSDQPIRVPQEVRLVKGPAFGQELEDWGQESGGDWATYRGDNARSGYSRASVPADLKEVWRADLGGRLSALTAAGGKVFVAQVDAHTLCALDARDGSLLWQYVAGGRVDSPPTCYRGLVLFGSRDGWVHCLRASDGALAWRFKDLPDKLIGAHAQLESAWPVCGSVLVREPASGSGRTVAYFAAGRSSFLDGGIFLYGLDPFSGEVIHRRQVFGPFDRRSGFPSTGPGAMKSDILVADDDLLYVRHRAFNLDLSDAASPRAHVFASAGFLDDTPQHRTYWTIGTGYGWTSMGNRPSGDILVTDGTDYYEVRGFPVHRHSYFDPRVRGYKLSAGSIGAGGDSGPRRRGKKRDAAQGRAGGKWSSDIPLTGKAMLLAERVVFVAGTPAYFPPDHPVEKYQAAYAGKLGGMLWAASTADGSKLAEYRLDAAPTWDGMAAAEGRLLLSLTDGSVLCLGE